MLGNPALATGQIQEVQVQVSLEKVNLDPALVERIARSIRAVTEKVFLGQDLTAASAMQEQALDTMKKILNRVITGFYIENLDIQIGQVTKIRAQVLPEDQVVERVQIELDAGSIHPFWRPTLEKVAVKILPQLEPFLLGIPVEAKNWAIQAVVPLVQARMDVERAFPGFKTNVSLDFGRTAIVHIRLIPKPPLVERVYVGVRAPDFPLLFGAYLRFALNQETPILVGMPIKFLARNRGQLEKYWQSKILGKRKEHYGIHVRVRSHIGAFTKIKVMILSRNLKAWAEMLVNAKTNQPNPELRGMVWWRVGKRNYAALRLDSQPADLNFKFQVGLLYQATRSLAIASLLDLNGISDVEWFRWKERKWQIEGVGNLSRKKGEVSIGYWITPYLRIDGLERSQAGVLARLAIRF